MHVYSSLQDRSVGTKKCSTHDIEFNFWPNFEKLQMLYYNYFIKGLHKLGRGY